MNHILSTCKKSIIFLSILFLLSVGIVTPVAQAQVMTKENEQVEQLADDLEFLMEEAAIYDSHGNLINFDFEKLEAKFGLLPEFELLEEEINTSLNSYNSASYEVMAMAKNHSWKSCMWDALKDHFGVTMVNLAINGGLWKYVEKKAYKEAARLLIKIGIGGNVVGLSAILIYYSAKCLPTWDDLK